MNPTIQELTAAVEQEASKRPEVLRLMTHPGVGPLTALAYVLIIGTPARFQRGKQIGTYVGMIPCEDSSGGGEVRSALPDISNNVGPVKRRLDRRWFSNSFFNTRNSRLVFSLLPRCHGLCGSQK